MKNLRTSEQSPPPHTPPPPLHLRARPVCRRRSPVRQENSSNVYRNLSMRSPEMVSSVSSLGFGPCAGAQSQRGSEPRGRHADGREVHCSALRRASSHATPMGCLHCLLLVASYEYSTYAPTCAAWRVTCTSCAAARRRTHGLRPELTAL